MPIDTFAYSIEKCRTLAFRKCGMNAQNIPRQIYKSITVISILYNICFSQTVDQHRTADKLKSLSAS